jgi:hypothetical protein
VALVCAASHGALYDGVTYRPIHHDGRHAQLPLIAVWNPDNDNPALRRFISLLRTPGTLSARAKC